MKILAFILIFLTANFLNYAQTPTWQWAKSGGGLLAEYGWKTAADDSGNVYVTGYFTSPSITIDSITLTNAGYQNIFVIKFSSAGNVIWASATSSEMMMFGRSIAVDNSGGVYIGGGFSGDSVVFGNSIVYNNDPAYSDILLLKYDSNGNELWAVSGGGAEGEGISNITVDENGFVFITGSFSSTVFTMGNISFANCDVASTDLFLIKFDSNGVLLWGSSPCGTFDEHASAITTDTAGNVYITGTFNSTLLDFGSDTLYNGTGIVYTDFFVAKYDTSGTVLWAVSEPNSYNQHAYGIAVDVQGNIYVTGSFDHPNFFIGLTPLAHSGSNDVFLARYDSIGIPVWAISGGSVSSEYPIGIEVDPSGHIIMAGSSYSHEMTLGSYTVVNAGNQDIFVARIDPSGNTEWLVSAGDTSSDAARGLTLDNNGDAIITGYFYSPAIAFGNYVVTNVLSNDFFVAKLSNSVGVPGETVNDTHIKIFPNPFSDDITLESGTKLNDATIEVFDMQGRSVYRFASIHGKEFSLNFTGRESGIYHLRLSDAAGLQIANEKIIFIETDQ